jgi:cyclin-dependent kinase
MDMVLILLCQLGFSLIYVLKLLYRLLGTPNEEMWPGVSNLMNWHEYPQWKPQSLSSAVTNLDKDGLDLLSVSRVHQQ